MNVFEEEARSIGRNVFEEEASNLSSANVFEQEEKAESKKPIKFQEISNLGETVNSALASASTNPNVFVDPTGSIFDPNMIRKGTVSQRAAGGAQSIGKLPTGQTGTGIAARVFAPSKENAETINRNAQYNIPTMAAAPGAGMDVWNNLNKVSSNITRQFAQGKPLDATTLETSEAGRPTTLNAERDQMADFAGMAMGVIAGLGGLSLSGLFTALKAGNPIIEALAKAGVNEADVAKLRKALPAIGQTGLGEARYRTILTDAVENRLRGLGENLKVSEADMRPNPQGRAAESQFVPSKLRPTITPAEGAEEAVVTSANLPKVTDTRVAGVDLGTDLVKPKPLEGIERAVPKTGDLVDLAPPGSKFSTTPKASVAPTEQAFGEVPATKSKPVFEEQGQFRVKDIDARRIANDYEKSLTSMKAELAEAERLKDTERASQLRNDIGAVSKQKRDLEVGLAPDYQDAIKEALDDNEKFKANLIDPVDKRKIDLLARSGNPAEAKEFQKKLSRYRSMDNWLVDNGAKTVVEPIHEAARGGDRWVHAKFTLLNEIMGDIEKGSEESNIIGKYLRGDLRPEEVPEHLRAIGDRARNEIFIPILQEIQNDKELGKIIGKVGTIQNYFPELEKAWATRYGQDNALALVHDLGADRFKARFFNKRTKKALDPMTDARQVLEMYINGSRKTLFDVKGYQRAEDALKKLPAGPSDMIRDIGSKYTKAYIGQPSMRGDVRVWDDADSAINRWYYRAYIGLNPKSALRNLTQNANTWVATGTKYFFQAAKDIATGNKEMEKMFNDTGLLSEFSGMDVVMPQLEKTLGTKIDKGLYWMFRQAETLNRKMAFNAGYHEAIDKLGLKGNDAINHALDVVHDTQFTYGRVSPTGISSHKVLGQFTNYPIKQMEFVIKSLKNDEQRGRMLGLLGAMGGMTALENRESLSKFGSAPSSKKGKMLKEGALTVAQDVISSGVPTPGPGIKDILNVTSYAFRPNQVTTKNILEGVAKRTPIASQLYKLYEEAQKVKKAGSAKKYLKSYFTAGD